jgi:hypothetical protein
MTLIDAKSVGRIARRAGKTDPVAKAFRDYILEKPCSTCEEMGVKFSPLPDNEYDFLAMVHRISLVVKYEHGLKTGDAGNGPDVFGIFRAYLNETMMVDRKVIASLNFDASASILMPELELMESLVPARPPVERCLLITSF